MRFHALLLLALTPSALAADWYVDPVNGSNANAGSSPGAAWATITYSLQQIPAGGHTLHLAPGTYGIATGEAFPIALRSGIALVGDSGPDDTIVHGLFSSAAFEGVSTTSVAGSFELQRFTVRNAQEGVFADAPTWPSLPLNLILRDMRFEGCRIGVRYLVQNVFMFPNILTMERVEAVGCMQAGLDVFALDFNDPDILVTDCTFRKCGTGARVGAGIECVLHADFVRCRFLDNSAEGLEIYHESSGRVRPEVQDCLIARNRRGFTTANTGHLRYTTIADNVEWGVRFSSMPQPSTGSLRGSIVYGNGDDLDVPNLFVTTSNIGDGDFQGMNGNISVDPLFLRPLIGDYRLGFGTGCVDSVVPGNAIDLAGKPRNRDGNLDLANANDMGCFELQPLDGPATASIGSRFELLLFGPAGSFTALSLDRNGLLGAPNATPFGPQWLDPAGVELVATRKIVSADPVRVKIDLPNSGALIGLTLGFQGLTRSPAAPAGAAYTNPVVVDVLP